MRVNTGPVPFLTHVGSSEKNTYSKFLSTRNLYLKSYPDGHNQKSTVQFHL